MLEAWISLYAGDGGSDAAAGRIHVRQEVLFRAAQNRIFNSSID
ncbi:MAG: hypothetical protein WBX25_30065 [Rhodomicrobium sp.]